jgi:hypothetical protein
MPTFWIILRKELGAQYSEVKHEWPDSRVVKKPVSLESRSWYCTDDFYRYSHEAQDDNDDDNDNEDMVRVRVQDAEHVGNGNEMPSSLKRASNYD